MISTKNLVMRNIICNGLGRVAGVLLNLVLTPYVLYVLGKHDCGLYWTIATLAGVGSSLADMGIAQGFGKFIAAYEAVGDQDKLSKVVNTGLFFYVVWGTLLVCAGLLFKAQVLRYLQLSPSPGSVGNFVYLSVLASLFITYQTNILDSILIGLQRMDMTNGISTLTSFANGLAVILLLRVGYGVKAYAMIQLATVLAGWIIKLIISFRLIPYVRIGFASFDFPTLKELSIFGSKLYVSTLSYNLSIQCPKFLIAHYLKVDAVSYYEVANRVVGFAISWTGIMISPLLPAYSAFYAAKTQVIAAVYERTSIFYSAVVIPLFVFIMCVAPLIVRGWIGPGFDRSIPLVEIMTGTWLLCTLNGPGWALVQAVDRAGILVKTSVVNIIISAAAGFLLIQRGGLLGIVAGTSFGIGVASLVFRWDIHQCVDIPLGPFCSRVFLRPILQSLVPAALLAGINFVAFPHGTGGRALTFSLLSIEFLAFSWSVFRYLFSSKYLSRDDRKVLWEAIPMVGRGAFPWVRSAVNKILPEFVPE